MGHRDTAITQVLEALRAGKILLAHNALDHEDTTVGPYHEAVDTGGRYAVISKTRTSVVTNARDAAEIFVDRVGTTRAREAVKKVWKKGRY